MEYYKRLWSNDKTVFNVYQLKIKGNKIMEKIWNIQLLKYDLYSLKMLNVKIILFLFNFMNYYYDAYSQSMSYEIPQSKNSFLKSTINLEKFEIGQSYVTCKIKNKENNSVVVNIQSGSPGIDLSYLLFNVADLPKFAYLRTMIDNKIFIRKLPVLGMKEWLLIYENTLFMLAVKDKYDELEIYCIS